MKNVFKAVAAACLLIVLAAPQSLGDASTSGWYTIPEAGTGIGVLGATYAEDLGDTVDGASFVRLNNSEVCDSVDDTSCAGGYAQMLLPPCSVDSASSCVESLEVGKEGGLVPAKFLRNVGKRIVKGDPSNGIPNGYNSSLWTVEGVNHSGNVNTYAVYAQMRIALNGKINAFRASVAPYVETVNPQVHELKFQEVTLASGYKRIVGNNSAHGCVWTDDGLCGTPANFADGNRVKLTLKISKSVAGFLNGRLENPVIGLTLIDSNYSRLAIEGSPVFVQKSFAKVLTSTASTNVLGLFNYEGFKTNEQVLNTYTATDNRALEYFDIWSPYFSSKADSIRTYWGFASADQSTNQCLVSDNKILGLVTTNAMVYDPKPPVFKDGELSYRVASVHSKPDGTDFNGIYDLVIASDAARCLYKYSNAPISASISITSSSGGEQKVATTVVNEKNGWFHLGAYGFGYSSPTLKVKLTQEVISPEPTPSPSASPMVTQSKASTVKSIICQKGKAKKTVKGANPKCPTGYKKVA